jgi:hypothetical protein
MVSTSTDVPISTVKVSFLSRGITPALLRNISRSPTNGHRPIAAIHTGRALQLSSTYGHPVQGSGVTEPGHFLRSIN